MFVCIIYYVLLNIKRCRSLFRIEHLCLPLKFEIKIDVNWMET